MHPGKFDCSIQILITFFIIALYQCFAPSAVWAGPPFVTDDPETVEYRHGEFYISSTYSNDDGKEGTLPHLELNYGLL